MQNMGYYAVQGHSRSLMSVPIKSLYATSFYWLILTNILSRTVSKLLQIIVQSLETVFLSPLWRLRDNIHCSS